MTETERAEALFKEDYNCAQAVLGAFSDKLGLTREQALAIAAPFGGGIGRTRGICGALSGLLMVYGLVSGGEDSRKKTEVYEKTKELMDAFKAQAGSTLCSELLGLDKGGVPAGEHPCPRLVRMAAELAGGLFEEN